MARFAATRTCRRFRERLAVAAHAQAGLGKVVGAEAEELGGLRDLVRGQCTARDFDHRADHVAQLDLLLGHDRFGGGVDDGDLEVEFLLESAMSIKPETVKPAVFLRITQADWKHKTVKIKVR
jgi:hypothetical protein